MIIIGAIAAVLVSGALVAWAIARVGVPGVADTVHTQAASVLPARPVAAGDVASLRFDQAIRGYRMNQVDETLQVLSDELAERDAEIARLRDKADREAGAAVSGRGEAHDHRG